MTLINDDIINSLSIPMLYETEEITDKMLLIKYIEPNTLWEWYLIEYDPQQKLAFGYVIGFEKEFGYFSIEEMEAIPTIIRVEEFKPIKFKDLDK